MDTGHSYIKNVSLHYFLIIARLVLTHIDCPTLSLTVSVQNKLATYNRLRLLGMEQKLTENGIMILCRAYLDVS